MITSASVVNLAEAVQQKFADYAQDKPQAQCVLLLDPCLRDAADDADFSKALATWCSASGNDLPLPRILWRHPNLMPAHRPYLAALDLRREADVQLLIAGLHLSLDDWDLPSLVQNRGHRICGCLFTQQSLEQYLGDLAVQRMILPKFSKRTLLRYYDPCVFPALWRICNAEQQRTLLGPIDRWLGLARNGQLQHYQAPSSTAAEPTSPQIHFSAEQWYAIQNIGALNQAIVQWQSRAENGRPPQPINLEATESALLRARRYGISDTQDLKAFAWHALTVHPQFDRHPLLQQAIARLPSEKYYAATVADFSEQEWQKVQLESSFR